MFGRDREQARLSQLLDAAVGGSGGLILIGGEVGIGKTTLVTSLKGEACARGIPVCVGCCYEFAATPPYGPWLDSGLFDLGTEEGPPLSGRGEEVANARNQGALFEQVQEYLEAVASRNPLVLILEDVHWADPSSLELLRSVSRDLSRLCILLVVTYRDDEVPRHCLLYRLLPTFVREARARRIELRRLGEGTIQELIASRYGLSQAEEGRLVTYLMDFAEGNPLFVRELLRTLEEEGILHPSSDNWSLNDLSSVRVPPLVRQVIDGRLRKLDHGTRDLLTVAAVIGQEVPFDLWRSVSGVTDDQLVSVVEQATDAHLIEESSDSRGLRFVHALIREGLYKEMALPRRWMWHRQVAESLSAATLHDPDAVAYHFRQAGDRRAVGWLVQAGLRAERSYAWATAADRFEAALACLEGDGDHDRERGWLLFRIGVLLRYIDTSRSISCLEGAERIAATTADRTLAVNSSFTRGFVRCMSGREMRRGLAEMEASIDTSEAMSAADLDPPASLAANASPIDEQVLFNTPDIPESLKTLNLGRNTLVEWLAHVGRYKEAVQIGESYVAHIVAEEPEEKLAYCNNAYFGLAVGHAALGRSEESRRFFALAHRAYRSCDHRIMESLALANELLLVVLTYHPEHVSERRRLAEEEISMQKWGAGALSGEVSWLGIGAHRLQVLEGQWQEARRLMWPNRGPSEVGVLRQYAYATLGELARYQGEPERAWEYVREVLPLGLATEPGDDRYSSVLAMQRLAAELALDAGDLATARPWIEAHDRWLAWSGALLWRSEGRLLWARYYHEAGDLSRARRYAGEALTFAGRPRQPLSLLSAHRLIGEIDTEAGSFTEGIEHIEESLLLAQACAAPYERALTLLAKAGVLISAGDVHGSRPVLAEAREICDALEAKPALERIAVLEERLTETCRALHDTSGLLSTREVEVLRLVSEGLTDGQVAERLFLSPRTVGNHLRSIYRKFDVPSRTAAARRAVERGLI